MCEPNAAVTPSSGYILSPRYMKPYQANSRCNLTLGLSLSGRGVHIRSLEMDLNADSNDDYVFFKTGSSNNIIKFRGHSKINISFHEPVTVGFRSGYRMKHHKGFLLQFEGRYIKKSNICCHVT